MTTVQIAIADQVYAQTITGLLHREGRYRLLMVAEPDLTLEGVIVLDCEHLDQLGELDNPERFVLITAKYPDKLARLWNAGVRHVAFREDSPRLVQLAVSAAELRQPRGILSRTSAPLPRAILERRYCRLLSPSMAGNGGGHSAAPCSRSYFPKKSLP